MRTSWLWWEFLVIQWAAVLCWLAVRGTRQDTGRRSLVPERGLPLGQTGQTRTGTRSQLGTVSLWSNV